MAAVDVVESLSPGQHAEHDGAIRFLSLRVCESHRYSALIARDVLPRPATSLDSYARIAHILRRPP